MRKAVLFVSLFSISAMYSCKVDQICASYQSYFLISPTPQPSAFSAQLGDSIPNHDVPDLFALVSEDGYPRKDLPNTEKDKNGLVKSEWAMVKNYNKRIVPMEVVIPEVSDSIIFRGDDIMLAERDVIDTLAIDSARNAANSFRYNNDQKFYNWYFREKLVWQDDQGEKESAVPPPAVIEEGEAKPEKEKKKLFKGLFKKKEKDQEALNPTDSIN
ncbi:MAG: hypothetical protein DRI71_03395 [Bacteroidetes bacterium]|nr:MAG: hypothetical protein DRI71_03395 [Bacteroidota bacterium]